MTTPHAVRTQAQPRHRPSATARPRLLIVDDFPCARAGLRALLSAAMRVDFLPDASDAELALAGARGAKPDLVVLEVAMANGDGLPTLRRLRAELPDIPVLAITISQNLELVAAAVRAGVHGYLVKTADQDALAGAVKTVLAGRLAIDPMLVIRAMQAGDPGMAGQPEPMPEPLTPREVEVLRLVSHGHTNREIAGQLFVAVGTVKVHLEHILAKLGASDRTDAAVRAQTMGLLESSAGRPMPAGDADLAGRPTRSGSSSPQSSNGSALTRLPSSDIGGT